MNYIIQKGLILFSMFIGSNVMAQTTINVASHTATLDGLVFDYSIGEMTSISTEKNSTFLITQGFLQPADSAKWSSSPTNLSPFSDVSSNIQIYPNPTEDLLFVESEDFNPGGVTLKLMDALGNVLKAQNEKQASGKNKYSLDLKSFANGQYFLLITKPDQDGLLVNYSYKIQKIN